MPGVPPVPIPNTAVKPRAANGSRTLGPARVGCCQDYSPVSQKEKPGFFLIIPVFSGFRRGLSLCLGNDLRWDGSSPPAPNLQPLRRKRRPTLIPLVPEPLNPLHHAAPRVVHFESTGDTSCRRVSPPQRLHQFPARRRRHRSTHESPPFC